MSNSDQVVTLQELLDEVREFAHIREWEQFHTPRNLVLALIGEVGELASELQWTHDADVAEALADQKRKDAIASELADVFNYLIRLADVLEIDLATALKSKIALNSIRYPAERSRGSSAKYTVYE